MCGEHIQSSDFHVFEMFDQHLEMFRESKLALELKDYPKLCELHARVIDEPSLLSYFGADCYTRCSALATRARAYAHASHRARASPQACHEQPAVRQLQGQGLR